MSKVISFRADDNTIKCIEKIREEWESFTRLKGCYSDADIIRNGIALLYDRDVRKVLEINVIDNPGEKI